ncbi:YwqG family protein [Streptomyces sp. ME19-01-6]|uniref:YwqG family protein n=1 Tax=Streptomyces sp. ME19-01-6 TaxID=3028686 RepID=UPI0029A3ABFD|nr:YwqG family protein [Streptomyces sp. ME19-01-6]MDX3226128.1 YwqG family protein [Streptomyces sp. ME19-01-6]
MLSLPLLSALAHERLPSELADRFCSLLEPRGQMLSAARPGDDRVGALGGEPLLPESLDWPTWEGHGPLSFIASLDCGPLSAAATGLALPTTGTLLFFYFDGQADDHEAWVSPSNPESLPGSRVLYVPAGTPVQPRPTPTPLKPYRQVPLRTDPAVDLPQLTNPELHEPLGLDHETVSTDPVYVEFQDAVWNLRRVLHQVGGEPANIQGEVAYEVADFPDDWDLDEFDPDNPHYDDILAEEARWRLLLQIASDEDADMLWGDAGALYWLITREDLAAHRFDQARFTWQCH